MFDSYINKNVVLILLDGFRKFGILISEDDSFVYLKFYSNGIIQPIRKSEIKDIGFDKKHSGVEG